MRSVKMAEYFDKDVVGTVLIELLKGLETSELGSVKYADVMCCCLRKGRAAGRIDRLIEIGRCCGLGWVESGCGKNQGRATVRTADCDRSKATEECGIFQLFVYRDHKLCKMCTGS
jgi:hypothetical protein